MGGAGLALLAVGVGAARVAAGAELPSAGAVAEHYREGPPPGFSGGFGEQSCHACHFDAEPNDGLGSLRISGYPDHYRPGETYPITVSLERAGMEAAGFQLAVRFAGDGGQAGSLTAPSDEDRRVAVSTDRGITYAFQTEIGSEPSASDAIRWVVAWTAPEGGATIHFHVAANAADGDGSADGDFVYTSMAESGPAVALP